MVWVFFGGERRGCQARQATLIPVRTMLQIEGGEETHTMGDELKAKVGQQSFDPPRPPPPPDLSFHFH